MRFVSGEQDKLPRPQKASKNRDRRQAWGLYCGQRVECGHTEGSHVGRGLCGLKFPQETVGFLINLPDESKREA